MRMISISHMVTLRQLLCLGKKRGKKRMETTWKLHAITHKWMLTAKIVWQLDSLRWRLKRKMMHCFMSVQMSCCITVKLFLNGTARHSRGLLLCSESCLMTDRISGKSRVLVTFTLNRVWFFHNCRKNEGFWNLPYFLLDILVFSIIVCSWCLLYLISLHLIFLMIYLYSSSNLWIPVIWWTPPSSALEMCIYGHSHHF